MNIYHYTTEAHLPAILEDGFLKLTPAPENLWPDERPMVWFTTLGDMPPTAIKPIRTKVETFRPTLEMLHHLIPIWRFRIIEPIKLAKWAKIQKLGARPYLAEVARDMGEAPSTWRASTKRVPLSKLALERRIGPQLYEPAEPPTEFATNVGIEVR